VTGNDNIKPCVCSPNNDKVIVYYQNEPYDVTNYIKRHPGGDNVIVKMNGKDVTADMKEIGHSKGAYRILEKFKVEK
jgi:cytochrome b involved in lipid metabolism